MYILGKLSINSCPSGLFFANSEKYLHTLLQVEILLRMWFPQMVPQSSITPTRGCPTLGLSCSHQNQLHIPVKASLSLNL